MEWWNDLWLNEGFASFMEYMCVDSIFPSWQMMDQFLISHEQRSLVSDAHADSHPISVPVKLSMPSRMIRSADHPFIDRSIN